MANWNGFRLFLFMASQGNSVSLGYIFRIYIIIFLFPLKSGVQEFQCYTLCCPLKYWSLWQFPLCKVTGHPNVTCCWHVVLVNSRLVHSPWLGSTGPHAPTWVLLAQTPPESYPYFLGYWTTGPHSLPESPMQNACPALSCLPSPC